MEFLILVLVIIVATVAATFSPAVDQLGRNGKRKIVLIGIGVLVIATGISSISIIDGGEVGVKVFFGSVSRTTVKAGINIINPFAKVVKYSTRINEYTMSSTRSEGGRIGDDSMSTRTLNETEVKIDMTVHYRIDAKSAYNIYTQVAKNENRVISKIVRPVARSVLPNVVVGYTNFSHLNRDRKNFAEKIVKAMMLKLKDKGVIVQDALVRKIRPPKSVDVAINNKLKRQQQIEEKTYQQTIAQKERNIRVIEAKGIAEAQRIINSTLSYYYLQYLAIKSQEKMAKSPNHTTVYIPSGANGIPLIKRIK